jgi:hypothetical protein
LEIYCDSEFDPDPFLKWFQDNGDGLEEAKISFKTSDLEIVIEKGTGGLFSINKTDISAPTMEDRF